MVASYDYIIVGAGSAGAVLAARLSEDPANRVLLLEAGPPDDDPAIRTPALMASLFHTRYDWDFRSQPQPEAGGRVVDWPLGRTLGGTSSTNAMIYVRGAPADFDRWRDEYGCEGWGHTDLLPYFERAEDVLRVESLRHRDPLTRAWVQAAIDYGLSANDDFNGAVQDGTGFFALNQRRGRRWSVADAYLRVNRPNLTVLTGATAHRVVIERGRAVGVIYRHGSEIVRARSGAEVILAAGAVKSPQLLLLSKVDNPAVGVGLQDHPRCTAVWRMAGQPRDYPFAALRWRLFGTGPLASNGGEAGGFVRTRPGLDAPDLQYMVCPPSVLDRGAPPSVAVLVTAIEVRSRGRIWLRDDDPESDPAIDPGYLTDPADLDVLVAGLRQAREIATHEPFASQVVSEAAPGPVDDSALREWARHNVVTMHHPTSTCAMGGGPSSVCDPQLRVRGVERLRVVDASVMPRIPRGNTNAPTIALAERACDLILGNTPLRGNTT